MRSLLQAAFRAVVLTAGCTNFSTDKTGSQQIDYDSTKGHFIPSNSWGSMNGEPMDMRKNR